jgi:O-glycosyl hydrolase
VSGGKALIQVTPYVTSATENLAAQPVIAVTNANFTATLGAQTVTTFVSN